MEISGREIEIIKSRRRSISLQIKRDNKIVVRAPVFTSEKRIKEFVISKEKWLKEHLNKITDMPKYTFIKEEIAKLKAQAKAVLIPIVETYSVKMGVKVGKVKIRAQKTVWGSCTINGDINLNCLLIKLPKEVCEYVIIHELSHRKQMNHSKKFWGIVKENCPRYVEYRKWLKDNGSAYLRGIER